MLEWIGIAAKVVLYGAIIVIVYPLNLLFGMDQRAPSVDDGVGYDDNDPGQDVDE